MNIEKMIPLPEPLKIGEVRVSRVGSNEFIVQRLLTKDQCRELYPDVCMECGAIHPNHHQHCKGVAD